MSCNGCRVLRKGCSENCILRPCLQWIESPEAQGYATVFVAKFFGRAGLMSFISAVPESQRPALFHSLLFEACGRSVNPVNGAVGLLWTGNWNVCQAAVETVLRGGTLQPMPELLNGESTFPVSDEASGADVASANALMKLQGSNNQFHHSRFSCSRSPRWSLKRKQIDGLDLKLTPTKEESCKRAGSPSMNSEESVVTNTTCLEGDNQCVNKEKKLLNLFI